MPSLTKTNLYRFTTGHFSQNASEGRFNAFGCALLLICRGGEEDAKICNYALYSKEGNRGGGASSLVNGKSNAATGSSASSGTSPVTSNSSNQPGELIYKVQIGAYRTDLSESKLSALKAQCSADISQSLSATGLHLIYAGSFKDYAPAMALKNDLQGKGMKDVFVAAFSGGERITLKKAGK